MYNFIFTTSSNQLAQQVPGITQHTRCRVPRAPGKFFFPEYSAATNTAKTNYLRRTRPPLSFASSEKKATHCCQPAANKGAAVQIRLVVCNIHYQFLALIPTSLSRRRLKKWLSGYIAVAGTIQELNEQTCGATTTTATATVIISQRPERD